MFLQVTFDDGSKLNIELTTLHTVQVIGPDNTIANAFNLGGVKDVSLEEGDVPAPVVAGPVEPVVPPTSDPNTVLPPVPTPDPTVATSETPPSDTGTPDASPTVSDPTSTGTDTTLTLTNVTAPDGTTVTPTPSDGSTDPAHDDAVVAATDNIQTATNAHPNDTPTLAAMALADVEEALAQWPDSPALLDAKTQLEALAAEPAA